MYNFIRTALMWVVYKSDRIYTSSCIVLRYSKLKGLLGLRFISKRKVINKKLALLFSFISKHDSGSFNLDNWIYLHKLVCLTEHRHFCKWFCINVLLRNRKYYTKKNCSYSYNNFLFRLNKSCIYILHIIYGGSEWIYFYVSWVATYCTAPNLEGRKL